MSLTDNDTGLVGRGLELVAKLSVSLDNHTAQMKREENWRAMARQSSAPVLTKIPFSGICSAAGFVLIQPGGGQAGPSQGNIWYVRRIIISGPDPSASITGTGYVYISASKRNAGQITTIAQLGAADLQDWTTTIPNKAWYGRGEMTLRMNESLMIAITGSANAQEINGSLLVEQFQEAALSQDWAV